MHSMGNAQQPALAVEQEPREEPSSLTQQNTAPHGNFESRLCEQETKINVMARFTKSNVLKPWQEETFPEITVQNFQSIGVSPNDFFGITDNFTPMNSDSIIGANRHGGEAKCGTRSRSQHVDNLGLGGSNNVSSAQKDSPGKLDGSFLTLGVGSSTRTRPDTRFSAREVSKKLEEAASFQRTQEATTSSSTLDAMISSPEESSAAISRIGGIIRGPDARASLQSPESVNLDYAQSNPESGVPASFASQPASSQLQNSDTGFLNAFRDYQDSLQSASGMWTDIPGSPTQVVNNSPSPFGLQSIASGNLNPLSEVNATHAAAHAQFPGSFGPVGSRGSFPSRLGIQPNDCAAPRPPEGKLHQAQIYQIQRRAFELHLLSGNLHQTQNPGPVYQPQRAVAPPFPIGNLHQAQNSRPVYQPERAGAPPFPIGYLHQARNSRPAYQPQRAAMPSFPIGNLHQAQNSRPAYQPERAVVSPFPIGNLHQTQNHVPLYQLERAVRPPFPIVFSRYMHPTQNSGSFSQPRRLGSFLPSIGNLHPTQNHGSVYHPQRPIIHPILNGAPQTLLRPQFNTDIPPSTTGSAIPGGRVEVKPQTPNNVPYQPSLKRKAIENAPAPPLVQRRKIMAQPPQPLPLQQPHFPAPVSKSPPVPPAPLHVKWEGPESPKKPIGHKCYLCKRDLSFTADGPVFQPAVPPPSAVLPCGHTFHDECMHKITSKDQLNNPPCIPCALGET